MTQPLTREPVSPRRVASNATQTRQQHLPAQHNAQTEQQFAGLSTMSSLVDCASVDSAYQSQTEPYFSNKNNNSSSQSTVSSSQPRNSQESQTSHESLPRSETSNAVPAAHSHRAFTPMDERADWQQQVIREAGSVPSSSSSSIASGSPTHGSKRTASGAVKTAITPLARLVGTGHSYHTRNLSSISGDSNTSRISELSSNLKTRLSYAMVKVQHGWEKNSIDEVESLAMQLSPPVSATRAAFSATSISGRGDATPSRVSMFNTNRRSRDLSHVVSSGVQMGAGHAAECGPGTRQMAARPLSGTYRQGMAPSNLQAHVPALALAPAPELSRSIRRRTSLTASHVPPQLKTAALANGHDTHRSTMTPTPQEQDAVDSLLFMSSPANSAYFPHHRSNGTSPSRHDFAMPHPRRRVAPPGNDRPPSLVAGFSASSEDDLNTSQEARRRSFKAPAATIKSESDVERLLDEMREARASAEDDDNNNNNIVPSSRRAFASPILVDGVKVSM